MMRSDSATEATTRESLDPGMDEMYGGRRSFSVFVYLIIIGVGICFGLVVLPALLAAVGWQDGASSVRDRGDEVVHAAPSKPDPRDKL